MKCSLKLMSLAAAMALMILATYRFAHFGPGQLVPVVSFNSAPKYREHEVNACSWIRTIGRDVQLPTVCANLTCKTAFLKHLQQGGGSCGNQEYPVPPVRHLLWRSENVSAHFAQQLLTWRQMHPDWTVVLWRDQDLLPFVKKHFPAAARRFVEVGSLPIMQVDMIRYMLLFKYGGVYADLDYSLSASLDSHRRFYAVVTREPEVHSLQNFGFRWPPALMASPAFMMSAPGHSFFRFCVDHLQTKPFREKEPSTFAGPYALSSLLQDFARAFPLANSALETVYVPPSYSFYPYEDNRLNTSRSFYTNQRMDSMRDSCRRVKPDWPEQLQRYCKDPNNMDPITDRSQPVVAVHDMKKSGAVYDGVGAQFYLEQGRRVADLFNGRLQLGRDWI